ncbi:embryonic protein UVS.2-like [Leptodactylus fuscus]|uniref:embryonic protein UVS.2-like n=1 Tax=Leptodactylus fuscus TaxID=238119 RepID=UPI003F4EB97F
MTNINDKSSYITEEPQGTFSKIIKANRGNNSLIHDDDMLISPGRSATTCTDCLWPKSENGTVNVPYVFSSNYSSWHLDLFNTSMQEFETLTCVRFVPRTTENDYLNIVSSHGCVSYVGRVGGGQRVGVDIGGCMYRGIIQHELNHALGFYHEHMRSDRDNYITIMYQYIPKGSVSNFAKLNTNNLGLEYDYGSVMHYDPWAFSNTSGQPTIVTIPIPNIPIGQRVGLSVLDASKINKLYQCDVCSNLLNEDNGTLTSANYPSSYPHNTNCVWLIRTPSNQVSLNFTAFDVQSSPNCTSDYIRIYDGPTKNYPLILDRTCGSGLIPPIISSTSQLLVEFSSDDSDAGFGFKALYSSVQCGGTFYTPQRTITSPGYPVRYYPNLRCIYTITAPVGRRIYLIVSDFQVESFTFCAFDYLKILDGTKKLAPHCGEKKIGPYTSSGNTLQLLFVSDSRNEFRGFQASYKFKKSMAIHNGDILTRPGRSATTCTDCLWPKSTNGTVNVPYVFSSNYSSSHLNLFNTSMQEYETLTCVRFVPWTTEDDYLNIMSSQGCESFVGRLGGGQKVGVDIEDCMYRGIIQHELNHALGFYHEHMRSDRDNYVTIMYQNIPAGALPNFDKLITNNLGLEYDYGSVMHYDAWAFSNTSGQPTIVTIPRPNIPIGQRDGLSVLDVSKINKLYQCDVCSNLLNEDNGTLTSANYPSSYPHNTNCVWLIRTPSNQYNGDHRTTGYKSY